MVHHLGYLGPTFGPGRDTLDGDTFREMVDQRLLVLVNVTKHLLEVLRCHSCYKIQGAFIFC